MTDIHPKDIDLFTKMLERAGIEFSVTTRVKFSYVEVEGGYIGFVSTFEFDEKGNLVSIGAYE